MKTGRFFAVLLSVILLAVAVDFAIGKLGNYLVTTTKGGNTGRNEYINKFTNEDILIFGSSRAAHHYDPRVLQDSLHMSAYNCGADGCGILLSFMQLSNILQRYSPKIVIYDLYGPYDFLAENDHSKYLGWERPYYGVLSEELDSVFNDVNPAERWKMMSQSYRYNSKIFSLIADKFAPRETDIQGYKPEYGTVGNSVSPPAAWADTGLDPIKMKYLRKFVSQLKSHGVRLVIAVSPYYFKSHDNQLPSEVRAIFDSVDALILDHSADKDFLGKSSLFSDTNHLNDEGAKLYTGKIAHEIMPAKN